jgi:hypothetical protein
VQRDGQVFVVEVERGEEFFAGPGVPVAEDEEVLAEFEGMEEGFGVIAEGTGGAVSRRWGSGRVGVTG